MRPLEFRRSVAAGAGSLEARDTISWNQSHGLKTGPAADRHFYYISKTQRRRFKLIETSGPTSDDACVVGEIYTL